MGPSYFKMIGPAQAAPRDDRNGRVEEGRGWKTERGDGGGRGEKREGTTGKGDVNKEPEDNATYALFRPWPGNRYTYIIV